MLAIVFIIGVFCAFKLALGMMKIFYDVVKAFVLSRNYYAYAIVVLMLCIMCYQAAKASRCKMLKEYDAIVNCTSDK